MKFLITGATGLVGTELVKSLKSQGHTDIRILTTNKSKALRSMPLPVEVMQWNPINRTIDAGSLEGVDIVFHLAGEGVADGKWTKERKERILKSRVLGTQLLIQEIQNSSTTPSKFISASAIGFYGDQADQELTTRSPKGSGFLADVCHQWESQLKNHELPGMQAHVLRTGLVLSSNGGALAKMLTPFKLGLGGKLGSGQQYMSWIHINDLIDSFIFLMQKNCSNFAYNGVSPNPVTNLEFTKTLGKALNRPTIAAVPTIALKTILGELADLLLASQKVFPSELMANGFTFRFENLAAALDDVI